MRTRFCTLPSYARKCKVWRVSVCPTAGALPPWLVRHYCQFYHTPFIAFLFSGYPLEHYHVKSLPNEPQVLNNKTCFEQGQGGASYWPPVSHTLPRSHIPSKLGHALNSWLTAAPPPPPTSMENPRSSPTSSEHPNPAM